MKKFLLGVVTAVIFFAGSFICETPSQTEFVSRASAEWYEDDWDDEDDWEDYDDEDEEDWDEDDEDGDYQNFAIEVLNLVNEERARVGVAPLRLAEDLQAAAEIRAREVVRKFSHTRPDGSSCFTVIRYQGRTCGENIAAGHATAAETVDGWMHSEGHRANILNPSFRELGVGYAYEGNSRYKHYWVQLFRG